MAGHQPKRDPDIPTRLEWAKTEYVEGRIEIEEFERRAGELLEGGTADQSAIVDLVGGLPRVAYRPLPTTEIGE